MGIPKFYRWLIRRYPMAVSKIQREEDMPPIDNLYIDTNGLVHMVVHGNTPEKHVLTSQMINSGATEELWCEIFRYIDDIVHIVNPRKVLYIALDSVTPIAKMTQQRARRIRTSQAVEESDQMAKQYGEAELFDLNAISPGTEFMRDLNTKIDFFLQKKINEDPLYQRLRIIFSDSNVPGEGEHKIMEYLRYYKISPEYIPNTRHCIYGLDADLIMLSLISHEPHAMIIREIVEHKPANIQAAKGISRPTLMKTQEYEVLYISIIREYFEIEYKELESKLNMKFDLERIIDDFIFFTLFVGNDFIPYLSTIDINYGSLDEIIRIYKKVLPTLNNYVTFHGEIQWNAAEKIFQELALLEKKNLNERKKECKETNKKILNENDKELVKEAIKLKKKKIKIEQVRKEGNLKAYIAYLTQKLQKEDAKEEVVFEDSSDIDPEMIPDSEISDPGDEDEDEVANEEAQNQGVNNAAERNRDFLEKICKLYEDDTKKAKQLYYLEKLRFDTETEQGKKELEAIISKYLEALQWVLFYYYRGVQHWGWFYCYHYAPLLSDITSVKKYYEEGKQVTFDHLKEANKPVTPYEQLLAILPRSSKKLLPNIYAQLYDPSSEIIDLYPENYSIDFNGRSLPWEAIKLIPFVDINRVIAAEKRILEKGNNFTPLELQRNDIHKPYLYVYLKSSNGPRMETDMKDMPGIGNSKCIKQEFSYIGAEKPGKFLCFLPELSSGTEPICFDFPSLKHLDVKGFHVSTISQAEINFEKIDLIIDCKIPENFEDYLNNPVYVDFPFQREAKILQIITKDTNIFLNNDGKIITSNKPGIGIIKKSKLSAQSRGLLFKPEPEFACICKILGVLTKNYLEGGLFQKTFSYKSFLVYGPLAMLHRDQRHYQNVDSWINNQMEQFPIGKTCCFLRDPDFGSIGNITHNFYQGQLAAFVTQTAKADVIKSLLDLCGNVAKPKNKDFISINALAKKMRTTPYVIGKLASAAIVRAKKEGQKRDQIPRYNIGLCIKNKAQQTHIPYHCMYNAKGKDYLLSREVEEAFLEYMVKFPEIFKFLEEKGLKTESKSFEASDIYPKEPDPEVPLKKIIGWILSLKIARLPYIPSGYEIINSAVKESIKDKLKINSDIQQGLFQVTTETKNVFVESYPFWIRPFKNKPYYEYQVGDRVVNIKTFGQGYVPFGYVGTVVGVFAGKILVEFDQPLLTGSTYWGQCEKYRGKILDSYGVLNLSLKRRSIRPAQQLQPDTNLPFPPPPIYRGPRSNRRGIPRDQQGFLPGSGRGSRYYS